MTRQKLLILILSVILLVAAPVSAQTLDDQLTWNDYFIAQQFSMFPRDARYDTFMNAIAQRLNATIVENFGEDKSITFYVCPSRLGFNAVSFHRFIVFDSVLLDSLRYLAMGRAYYGGINTQYTERLAAAVAKVSQARQMGQMMGNYNDTVNPFGLPSPGQLNPQQQKEAEAIFAEMLASWMAHEGSHCMRDHMKTRLEAASRQNQNMNLMNQQQFMNNVNTYMNAKISQEFEKDADVHAARWLLRSGFTTEGYIMWLEFGEKLEKMMGVDNAYLRTHPKCSDRIRYIRAEAMNFRR